MSAYSVEKGKYKSCDDMVFRSVAGGTRLHEIKRRSKYVYIRGHCHRAYIDTYFGILVNYGWEEW